MVVSFFIIAEGYILFEPYAYYANEAGYHYKKT